MIYRTNIEHMAYSNYRLYCLEPIGSYIKHISLLIYLDIV